jgi:hypothetical protein
MRRAAGGGDDDLDAARFRGFRVLEHPIGRPVRRHDPNLVRNLELCQQVDGRAHHLEVVLASHYDGNPRCRVAPCLPRACGHWGFSDPA